MTDHKDRERIQIYQEFGDYTLINPEKIERILLVMILDERPYLMIHTEKCSFRIELFDNLDLYEARAGGHLNILGDKLISIKYKTINNRDIVVIETDSHDLVIC